MTLTAEGLRVLPGQLPFQCPAGEGKAHRAEPAECAGWARCRPGTSPSLLVILCSRAGGRTGRSAGGPPTPGMDGSYPAVTQLLRVLGAGSACWLGPLPAMPHV